MGASVRLRLLDTRVPIFPAAPTTATLIEGSSSTVLPYRGLSCLLLVIGDSFVTVRRGVAGRCGRGRGRMRTGGRGAAVEGPLDGGSAGRWGGGRMRGRAEGSAGGRGVGGGGGMRTGGRGAAVEGPLDGGSAGRWVVGRMRGRAEGSAGGQVVGPRDRWPEEVGPPGGGRCARCQPGVDGRCSVRQDRRAARVRSVHARSVVTVVSRSPCQGSQCSTMALGQMRSCRAVVLVGAERLPVPGVPAP